MLHVRGGALRKQTHDGGPIEFLAFSLAHFIRGGLPSLMHADRAKYLPTFHLFPPGLERLRICIIFIWSFTAAGPPRGGEERRRILSPSLPSPSPPLSLSLSLSLALSPPHLISLFSLSSSALRLFYRPRLGKLCSRAILSPSPSPRRVSSFRKPRVSMIIDNR